MKLMNQRKKYSSGLFWVYAAIVGYIAVWLAAVGCVAYVGYLVICALQKYVGG